MTQRLLLASEVVAFTDAELDQYLEASRLPNGDRMVQVVDPDNLPDIFINRLRFEPDSVPLASWVCLILDSRQGPRPSALQACGP